ncbi:hypothetical protein E3J79_01380 [Candidatus Dependentiae bacterium]|nr:MAG: hypothetical protein E3J79_01380 [Candidatus Dependentiae bacterium]
MQRVFLALSYLTTISNIPGLSIQDFINNNQLSSIARNETTNKLMLDLSNKNLTSLDGLQNIPHKRKFGFLNLSFNKIKKLPPGIFQGFHNLEYIDLSDNQLTELPEESFKNLPQLKILFLCNNKKLRKFSPDIFQGLVSLEKIGLSNEQLKKLNSDVFQDLTNPKIIVLIIN